MNTSIKILRDTADFPSHIQIKKGGRTYNIVYDRDREITFDTARLPPEIVELAKLVYPFAEKTTIETFDSGEFVSADMNLTDGQVTTTLYTVPAKKKLYILNAALSSCPAATTNTPVYSILYVWRTWDNVSSQIIIHYYKSLAALQDQVRTDVCGPIEFGFPEGFQVRVYTAASASSAAAIIGVLKDL